MGPEGLKQAASLSASKAHYMASKRAEAGFEPVSEDFLNEFVTVSHKSSQKVVDALEEKGILGGLPLDEKRILWCCTEMNSKAQIDEVVEIVKEVG